MCIYLCVWCVSIVIILLLIDLGINSDLMPPHFQMPRIYVPQVRLLPCLTV